MSESKPTTIFASGNSGPPVAYLAATAAALQVSVSTSGNNSDGKAAEGARAKIKPFGKGQPFSAADLRRRLTPLREQAASAKSSGEDVDSDRIDGWLSRAEDQLDALDAALADQGKDDAHALTMDTLTADYESRDDAADAKARQKLAEAFRRVVITLGNVQRTLNDAFDKAVVDAQEQREIAAQEALVAEQEALLAEYAKKQRELSGAKKGTQTSGKPGGKTGDKKSDETGEQPEDQEEEQGAKFPHNGKHRPPRGAVGQPKLLCKETGGGGDALYLTSNAATVIKWETEAINDGLELLDKFTIVHKFTFEVGADQGSMTRCMRMEGTHHGHPIIESGSKTSFDAYVSGDINTLVTKAKTDEEGAIAGLNLIIAYLKRVGATPSAWLNKVPKALREKLTL